MSTQTNQQQHSGLPHDAREWVFEFCDKNSLTPDSKTELLGYLDNFADGWWLMAEESVIADQQQAAKDQTLDQLIKETFPLPSKDALTRETEHNIPFGMFGITGGYGETRRALVDAILLNEPALTESLFYSLIREGIDDFLYEQGSEDPDNDLTPERAVLELRDYVQNRTSLYPPDEVGKTYRILASDFGSVVGSQFVVERADEHEFHCVSDLPANQGAFGIEDFRQQVASGQLEEVK